MITGINGFLGTQVARRFRAEGWVVVGVGRSAPGPDVQAAVSRYLHLALPDPGFRQILFDLQPAVLVHCAGRSSVPLSVKDPAGDFSSGPVLVFEVLEHLRLYSPHTRFVFLSSAAVYGNPANLPVSEDAPARPVSPYGYHKWQGEQLCTMFASLYGLPAASLRVFSAYGPGLRRQVIWDVCRKVTGQSAATLQGTGRESRDFVHAADVAAGVLRVAEAAPMAGEAYNLASGEETTIAALARLVVGLLAPRCRVEFSGEVPAGTPLNWRADVAKIGRLGFAPTVSLEKGVAEFAGWFRQEVPQ
jgi:UDP-glucose 4-epimerase